MTMSITPASASNHFSPLVSIIVPTYNRPDALRRCLSSLAGLAVESPQFEVIVVDDGSTGSCAGIVADELAGLDWKFLRQENKGPATARNLGASHAQGRYLAFVDDDCSLPKDWLIMVGRFLDGKTLLGGQTVNLLTNNIFAAASQELVEFLYGYFSQNSREAQFITSNNMIVPTALFMSVGGFSRQFKKAAAEDRDFCDRWLLTGHGIRFVQEIIVEHWHELTLCKFLRQHFGYGLGASLYHEMRGARRGTAIRPEPLRFYTDLVLFPLRQRKGRQAAALSLFLLLSQVSNAAGFFWAKATRLKIKGKTALQRL